MRKPVRSPAIGPLILLAAVLWSGEMVRRDLWTPDEVRYAYVAREMAKDGHWLVPHRSGEYYAHKPPLLFWLINLGSRITRLPIGPVTSRLPGFFSGILVLWITARLAGRWRGPGAAWPAVLVLCTNYLFWHEVGFGRTDALLLGCSLSALYLLVRNDEAPAGWRPVLAYAAMGLGILTKGPVGFLVPVGAYIAMRLAAGEGRLLKKGHWGWGPLVTLSFPALWLGLAWWTGAPEGFLNEVLFKQNVARAAGELGHEQPWYYFFTNLPVDFLPWTLLLPAAGLALFRDPDARVFRRRLAGWILFIVLFFTLITSKRHIYILAAFPALALLVGGAWEAMARAPGRWVRFGIFSLLGLYVVVGAGCLFAGLHPKLPIPAWTLWPTGLVGGAGAAWLAVELRRRGITLRIFYTLAVIMLATQWTVGTWIYPAINPLKTPVDLIRVAQEKIKPGHPLLLYKMNGEIYAFYTGRPGRVFWSLPEMETAMRREQSGIAVFEEREWASVRDALSVPGTATSFKSGSKHLVRFEYRTEDKAP